MSTAGERALALAVACGLLEPEEARDTDLDALVAAGRLSGHTHSQPCSQYQCDWQFLHVFHIKPLL